MTMNVTGPSPNRNSAPSPALPLTHSWGPSLSAVERAELLPIIEAALKLVESLQPNRNNLFSWSGDRRSIDRKSFELAITTSSDPAWVGFLRDNPHSDAMTITLLDNSGGSRIITALFADRLFIDEHGNERPSGFANAVVSLAREIYGSVQVALELKSEEFRNFSEERKQKIISSSSLNARAEAICFLDRLEATEFFSLLPERSKTFYQRAKLQVEVEIRELIAQENKRPLSPSVFPIFELSQPELNRSLIFESLLFALRDTPSTRNVEEDRAFTRGDHSKILPERGLGIRSFMQTVRHFCLSIGIFENIQDNRKSPLRYHLSDMGLNTSDGVLGDRIAALCSLDAIRTRQYCLALDQAISEKLATRKAKPGEAVIGDKIRIYDVGCGPFPLYSFYAAMAFPGLVECVAVEKNPKSLQTSQAIIRHLGLEGVIQVVEADALSSGLYLDTRHPEIMITETFNRAGTQEHGTSILKNCWDETNETCITIPSRVTIHAALVPSESLETLLDSLCRAELLLDYEYFRSTVWSSQIACYGRGETNDEIIKGLVPIPSKGEFKLLAWAEYDLYGSIRLGIYDSFISAPILLAASDRSSLVIIGDPSASLQAELRYSPGADYPVATLRPADMTDVS